MTARHWITAATPEIMREIGFRIGAVCVGGDVVILTGELAAGKTTLTQGIAKGIGIQERVTSPTFVISRVHVNQGHGPDLIHVDAYRLGSSFELDDIDVVSDLESSVVVVEWGAGIADSLADERLLVDIHDDGSDVRVVELTAIGERWADPVELLLNVTP